jgi:hypothetical protein
MVSSSTVEASAEFIGSGTVAAVSSMRIHLRQSLDVIANTRGHGGQGFARVELCRGVPVAQVVEPNTGCTRNPIGEPFERLRQSVGTNRHAASRVGDKVGDHERI